MLPGKEPFFFDEKRGVIFENTVNGALLGCEGCSSSIEQSGLQVPLKVSQHIIRLNNNYLANENDHMEQCIKPFLYCENRPLASNESSNTILVAGKPTKVYKCIPDTRDIWQETNPDKNIGDGQALLCDTTDYTNSSKLFCSKGNSWIYILTSGQTISDTDLLEAFEENRDAFIKICEIQFAQLNVEGHKKSDWDVRELSPREVKFAATWYVDALIGIMKSKDKNGFVNFYELGYMDPTAQRSLSALAGCLPADDADPLTNGLWEGYREDPLSSIAEKLLHAFRNSGQLNDATKNGLVTTYRYGSMSFNKEMLDYMAFGYLNQNSDGKNLWETTKILFKFFAVPGISGWLTGKLTTGAMGLKIPVKYTPFVRTAMAGVSNSLISAPLNFVPVTDDKGQIIGRKYDFKQTLNDFISGVISQGATEIEKTNKLVKEGYKLDKNNNWHRPNGQFPTYAEVGYTTDTVPADITPDWQSAITDTIDSIQESEDEINTLQKQLNAIRVK